MFPYFLHITKDPMHPSIHFTMLSRSRHLVIVVIFLFLLILQAAGQSLLPMGSERFPVNDNNLGSQTAAVNGGWQVNGYGKVCRIIRYSANVLYACAASGGIYQSTDNGSSWHCLSGSVVPGVQMNALAVDPSNPSVLFAGTGEPYYAGAYGWGGFGVFKSTDGGATWSMANTGMGNQVVSDLLLDFNNPSLLIACCAGGIYRSVNGGTTWTLQASSTTWMEQVVRRGASDTLFAVSGNMLYSSPDFGATWTVQSLDPANSGTYRKGRIAVAPSDDNVIYVTWISRQGSNNCQSEVFRSSNGGISFVKTYSYTSLPALASYSGTVASGGYGWANYCIAVDPNNANTVYTGAHLIFKSTNGALTFSPVYSSWYCCLHTDIHQLLFSGAGSDSLFAASDGGIFLSANRGVNWQSSSDGLNCTQYFSFGQSHLDSTYAVGGTQDNGILFLKNDTLMHTYAGGDYSAFTLCDYFHPHNTYTNSGSGIVFDPYNRTISASVNLPSEIVASTYKHCIEFSPRNAGRAFAFRYNVWVTSNLSSYTMSNSGGTSSVSWSQLTSLSGVTVTALAISPRSDDTLYFVTSNNRFYTCTLSSGALQSISFVPLPGSSNITASIAVSALNPDVIYVMMNSQVFRSANKGQNIENITRNLPSINHEALYIDPFSTVEGLYLVNDFGVYYSDLTLASWQDLNAGFPVNLQNPNANFYRVVAGTGCYLDSGSAGSYVSFGTWGAGFRKASFYRQSCAPAPAAQQLRSYGSSFATHDICYDNVRPGAAPAYTLYTSGSGINDTSDQFSMLMQRLVHDGSITATVFSVEKGEETAPGQTGLMMRPDSYASDAPFAMAGLNGDGHFFFRYRPSAGAAAVDFAVITPQNPYPAVIRLSRVADTVTAWFGQTLVGHVVVALGDTLAAGMAASAGSNSLINRTAFSDITDSGFALLPANVQGPDPFRAVLYPDPAHKQITVSLSMATDAVYSIYDMLAKPVAAGTIPANARSMNIDISLLPAGTYVVDVKTRRGNASCRLRFVKY